MENLWAQHSIKYTNLKSYFYVFSIWDNNNVCLSWDDTTEWAALLDLQLVPVIYRGVWSDEPAQIHKLFTSKYSESDTEGYVIRNAGAFHYSTFSSNTMKYVRKNHVTSASHWKYSQIEKNKLVD